MGRSRVWRNRRDDRVDRTTSARQRLRRFPKVQMLLTQLNAFLLQLPQLVRRHGDVRQVEFGKLRAALRRHGADDGFSSLCCCGLEVILGSGSPDITLCVRTR